RDGEHVATGLLLVSGHPFPQFPRVGAAERRLRGVRLYEAGLRGVVAEDDVSMQVVAASIGGPLVADEGSEAARIVRTFGRLDDFLPDRAVNGRARQGHDFLWNRSRAKGGDDVHSGCRALAVLDLF